MINLTFSIKNPFPKDNFVNLWNKNGSITEFKHWEAQISYCRENIFGIKIDTDWRGRDHAGPEIVLTLFGLSINLRLYDSRHWDYKRSRWMIYE
jgi:hypothetical protein